MIGRGYLTMRTKFEKTSRVVNHMQHMLHELMWLPNNCDESPYCRKREVVFIIATPAYVMSPFLSVSPVSISRGLENNQHMKEVPRPRIKHTPSHWPRKFGILTWGILLMMSENAMLPLAVAI